MKFFTTTALLGAFATLPFLFGRRKPDLAPVSVKPEQKPNDREANLRYDVDDFMTQ
jgi:hypothetical protein